MIEFEALAMKAETNNIHTHSGTRDTQGVEGGNYLSQTRI